MDKFNNAPETILAKSSNWNLLLEDDKLVISGGADDLYMVDDLPIEISKQIYEAYNAGTFESLDRSNSSIEKTLNSLTTAGVLFKKLAINTNQVKFSIQWVGNPIDRMEGYLRNFIGKNESITWDQNNPDVLVIIRSNAEFKNILDLYSEIKLPHFFVDIGYKNHASFGPFVIPNETACLSCFLGRIMRSWGDPMPPQMPLANEHPEIVSAMIFEYLSSFQEQKSCPSIIERVLSIDLKSMETQVDPVFRLPWCPTCKETAQSKTGNYELPWIKK